MKVLIAYNFLTEEAHVEAPNFYRSCAEQIFPKYGIETTFLPNLREHLFFRLLLFVKVKEFHALTASIAWWIFCNGHRFDIIVGWVSNGIIAALLKFFLPWRRTRVCLILYKLPNDNQRGLMVSIKKLVINIASRGADLLLALDKTQADFFAKTLCRKKETTQALRYGIDTNWYDIIVQHQRPRTTTRSIFCPGSAYRDDKTLELAIIDLDVHVNKFQLDKSRVFTITKTMVGKACIEKFYNAPYARYMTECQSASIVVISVANANKPVGLTSLLECMALGCAVIIPRGASSNDYVRDGVTALLYQEGNWKELRQKIDHLFNNPDIANKIRIAARESVQTEFGLNTCGQLFSRSLYEMKMTNA